ncbi:MAG: response regulator [Bacteroidetes bacterium]|nr:MAG: response regulator [Bacteroidota bacterium]
MKIKTNRGGKKTIGPGGKGMAFAQPLTMKKKILVADDDSSLRDIFKIILAKAGYDIELKEDANEIFKNNFKIPDLFLIDKLLSGVDGLEVCRYLKNNPSTSNIPIVMISASPDIAAAATYAGADDFIEKPFESKHLLSVIERNISRAKTPELNKKRLNK